MRLITVLNRCTEFKRFVIEESRFDEHGEIMVSLRSRKNSKGESSCCGQLSPTYDTAAEARLFEFIPFWGFPVFLVYRMRRVACKACDRVVVEKVPWSSGKHHLTDIYRCFLAQWAKKLSWTEVARSFRTSWDKVYHSVKYVVEYGIAHRCLDQVTALGVDEIQYRKGYHFLTLVYQIDTRRRRLLWMGEKRTKKSLDDGFTELEQEQKFLQRWCYRTMRSKIKPMKDIAKMLRRHQPLILNWFRAKKQFNNGIVEGLNLKWNLTVRKAFGFRTFKALQMASFHQLGDLPEPQLTHEFY